VTKQLQRRGRRRRDIDIHKRWATRARWSHRVAPVPVDWSWDAHTAFATRVFNNRGIWVDEHDESWHGRLGGALHRDPGTGAKAKHSWSNGNAL